MLRIASKEILYHGTATGKNDEILIRILKEGLNPTPKRRVFQDDDRRDLATLGGVYLSARPEDASKFSMLAQQQFGGDRMAVIVQFETRTPRTTLDEDELFPVGRQFVHLDAYGRDELNVTEVSGSLLLNYLERDLPDWNAVAEHFLDEKVERIWGELDPRARARMIEPVADLMKWQAFYREAEQAEYDGYWYRQQYDEQIGVSSAEAFRQVQRATKAAMAALRQLATPPPAQSGSEDDDDYDWMVARQRQNQKIQTEIPITYRGANRILAVLRWREGLKENEGTGYYVVGEVVWATPEGLREAKQLIEGTIRQLKSQHMLWTGPKGQVLYDVQEEPEQRAASVYQYAGAHYRCAATNIATEGFWRQVGDILGTTKVETGTSTRPPPGASGQQKFTVDWRFWAVLTGQNTTVKIEVYQGNTPSGAAEPPRKNPREVYYVVQDSPLTARKDERDTPASPADAARDIQRLVQESRRDRKQQEREDQQYRQQRKELGRRFLDRQLELHDEASQMTDQEIRQGFYRRRIFRLELQRRLVQIKYATQAELRSAYVWYQMQQQWPEEDWPIRIL